PVEIHQIRPLRNLPGEFGHKPQAEQTPRIALYKMVHPQLKKFILFHVRRQGLFSIICLLIFYYL
ncbi:hypothetical protein, partial [Desulfovibrio piger]|uniref:hypothetical protein n=1 Tax=Desulfovibrio piger TaxID=901 RepID=UPI0030782750